MSDAEFTLTDLDFQLESLNFSDLSPAEFENLIFHLVDEMGFSNLVWRKGGEGNSATDGGRDLEASYWRVEPVGSTSLTYWFEVKYRTGQLNKLQVQKAVLDASADSKLDHVVIATNSTVSNPCLDWIREFSSKHPRPSISVWQGHDLELLLRKNPRTLARFIPTALSFSGRCKVIESRFLNLLLLPSIDELVEVWSNRESIRDPTFLFLAAILSESAYGDLVKRPWGMVLGRDVLLSTAASAFVNVYLFIVRISTFNRSQKPFIDGLAYLLACVLVRDGYEIATRLLFEPESYFESRKSPPPPINRLRLEPILATLYDQLAVHCSSVGSCSKLHYRDEDLRPPYFARFRKGIPSATKDDRFVVLSSTQHACELAIVELNDYCPLPEGLPDGEISRAEVSKRLKFAESVLTRRVEELDSGTPPS